LQSQQSITARKEAIYISR